MSIEMWTLLIGSLTAVTCGLCGSLLLVNRQSMVSEGLSHAILPGLVLAFLFFQSYESPWLIVLAALSGLIMVWATEALANTRLVDPDAGLGIVFAGMFSLGILIVSMKLRNSHFHADCIIDGNLALAPLDQVSLFGLGPFPKSFLTMAFTFLIVLGFILLTYKELKVMIFDPLLAKRVGLKPTLIRYAWISLVSLTTVAAFNVAGSILIVALMIAPPAAAFLMTKRLSVLMYLASCIAVLSAVLGFYLAKYLDVSPTGPMASVSGAVFLFVLFFVPQQGLLALLLRRFGNRSLLNRNLALELASTAPSKAEAIQQIEQVLSMEAAPAEQLFNRLVAESLITPELELTPQGQAALPFQTG